MVIIKESRDKIMSNRAIISCFLAIVFSLFFKIALSLFFSHELGERELLDPISNDWYINAFFTSRNQGVLGEAANEDIIIINLTDSVGSRGDIAEIVRYVAKQHPKVMGIDIIFPDNGDVSNFDLLNAIADSRKETEIVVSAYWDDIAEEMCHSFFMNELSSIKFGMVNQPNYTNLDPEYKGYPTFSAQISKCAGVEEVFSEKKAVNYRTKNFKGDNITNINSIDIGDVKGKIVLLGNAETPSDIKNLPFYIHDRNQLSGVEILAYQINTLLASSKEKDKYQSPLNYNNSIYDFLICFIALFLYLFIVIVINQIDDSCRKWGWKILVFISKFIFLILSECVIIWMCFSITNYLLVIPDITLFVVSIIFVEEVYKKTPDISFNRIKTILKNSV